ncbi:hypothetical protein PAMA_020279 [Pampus argenteus]
MVIMTTNASSTKLLTLGTLDISDAHVYPAFVFGTIIYLIIVFCNLLILISIAVSKKLHKPMFILLFNLPISDMLGATAFFPQFVISIVTHSRLISHPACITQAFLLHVYGTGNMLSLTAMAYDRYVAICHPLRYNAIMNTNNLIKIIFSIWLINLSFMVTLFILHARFKLCRTNIVDLYCNNPSLLKLACESTDVNNYYGFATTVLIQGGVLFVIYTYAQILYTCVMTNQPDARRKAIQMCSTHLAVYLILQINTLFTIIAHRVESASPYLRRSFSLSVLIFPPILNPIIYGLKITELKESIILFLKINICSMK